jgi:hypothetical protein
MECYKDFKSPYFLWTCHPQTWAPLYRTVTFVLQMVYTLDLREGIDILCEVFFTGEAWFHFSDNITRQNSRILSAENHQTFRVRSLYFLKIQICCVVSLWRTVSAIFFIQMLTTGCYLKLIVNFISLLQVQEQDCQFQQDGFMAHTATSAMWMLYEFFCGCIVS